MQLLTDLLCSVPLNFRGGLNNFFPSLFLRTLLSRVLHSVRDQTYQEVGGLNL